MLYRTYRVPPRAILLCGRQLGKSITGLAVPQVLKAAFLPDYSILYISPLAEQTRKFSNTYVRRLIVESPFRHLLVAKGGADSTGQKDFLSGGMLLYSYAGRDAERVRGSEPEEVCFDEL